jgi:hypothetical protein
MSTCLGNYRCGPRSEMALSQLRLGLGVPFMLTRVTNGLYHDLANDHA